MTNVLRKGRTQVARWAWVLVLVQIVTGCMSATEYVDGTDARGEHDAALEADGSPDAGSRADKNERPDAGPDAVEIRDGAVDLRDKAQQEVEAARDAATKTDPVEQPAATNLVPLSGKAMQILETNLQEVEQGFQLRISCNDDSVDRTRYDYHTGRRRSARCEIDPASARQSLEFEPALSSYRLASTGRDLLVIADFERKKYALRIKAGLRTRDGGELREDVEQTFEVGKRSPNARFVASGRYMPRDAWQEVGLSHRNLEAVELEVRHVPGRNMAFWMSGYRDTVDTRSGDLVLAKQLQLKDTVDQQLTTTLPMNSLLGTPEPGLYELRVSAPNVVDTLRVVVTDIQLIAKRSDEEYAEEVDIWAVNSQTLQPLAGARVRAILKSGTVSAKCTTNRAGHCRIRVETGDADQKKQHVRERTPFALLVSHKDDATYLKYSELRTELASGETHGAPYRDDRAYKGFVYADRDLYRPADVVHIAAMLRDTDLASAGAGVPVEMVILDSRAQIVSRKPLKTNAGGMVTLDHRLTDNAMTGQWRARLEVGKRQVASFGFSVEEFMPERLKVEAAASTSHIGDSDPFKVDVHARYLFGASAEGSEATMRCEQTAMPFQPEKHAGYHYGTLTMPVLDGDDEDTAEADQGRMVVANPAVIDANDRATLACDFAANQAVMASTTRIRAEVGVSESGSGRTTHALAEGWRHPASFYIGVRADKETVTRGNPVTLDGIIVDWEGAIQQGIDEVEVDIVQLRSQWAYSRSRGRYTRRWIQVVEESRRVAVKEGKFKFAFTPESSSYDYAVRLRAKNARTDLRIQRGRYYWAWRYGYMNSSTSQAIKARSLTLKSRGSVGVNEAHSVSFEAEFKGRALLTVETDRVLKSDWVDVEPGKITWDFKVDAFAPNVYVSAMLIKDPHTEAAESFLPERAFGAVSIPMKRHKFTRQIKLKTPEIMRPGTTLEVEVDAGKNAGNSYVTIAAVDEGILSLTDYQSPNPLDSLLARRALGVKTYDTIGWTLQLANLNPRSKTGGSDGESQAGIGRMMPFKPVALWSGLKRLPKSGKLKVSLDVPLYQGELRVMAVVVTPEKIGRAERQIKVRDPIVVQPTFPRFLIAGDQVDIPVFLSNTTATNQEITVEISADELAEPGLFSNPNPAEIIGIEGDKFRTISLKPGKSKAVVFKARALRSAGAATFLVSATGRSEDGKTLKSRAEGVVPFRAAGPLERKTETMLISTQSVDLKDMLQGWEPASETTTLRITSNPHAGAFEHLSALVRYPYGCLEQTISQLRPMVYLSKLVRAVDPHHVAKHKNVDHMIASGIARVLSMQTPSGGFGFWTGDGQPHPWATPYAIYLLMDAQKRGYTVPQERIARALDWLEGEVKRQQSAGYGRSNYYSERYSPGFSHYVLAIAGRANQGQIRKTIEASSKEPKGEELESVYLMKAALYLSGDRSFERDLKAFSVDATENSTANYRSYYSTRRRNALLLNVFVDLFGPHQNALEMVNQLGETFSKTRNTGYLYSTQEMGWGLTALGKWYTENEKDMVSAKLYANGREVADEAAATPSNKNALRNWGLVRASEYETLRLELDKMPDTPLYLIATSKGVRTNPNVEFGGNGLSVTREYLNESGDKIGGKVELGDLVYVRVRLKSTTRRNLENIALVDRLPAGFEIENPRLGAEIMPAWASDRSAWHLDHTNMRDDRLEAFGTVNSRQEVELIYAVRATLAGKFHAPSIEAEGMYDTDIWAREAPTAIEVTHAWPEMID